MVVPARRSKGTPGRAQNDFLKVALAIAILIIAFQNTRSTVTFDLGLLGCDVPAGSTTEKTVESIKASMPGPVAGMEILQHSGKNWKIWDASSTAPLYNDRGFECDWLPIASGPPSSKQGEICGKPGKDAVGSRIRKKKYFDCCRPMPSRYVSAFNRAGQASDDPNRPKVMPVHVEIGANIGACVMEMLLSDPNMHLIAFEPYPPNLFRLTSTLLRNPDLHRRVTVFPIGLGDSSATVSMATELGSNFGSARVDPNVDTSSNSAGTEGIGRMGPVEMVSIEPLDKILAVTDPKAVIPLVKMDIQGFECRVLDGMVKILEHTDQVYTELEGGLLSYQGCSSAGLVEKLTKLVGRPVIVKEIADMSPLPETNLPDTANILSVKHPEQHGMPDYYAPTK